MDQLPKTMKEIKECIGTSLSIHRFSGYRNGAAIEAQVKVTIKAGLVKTAYLHIWIEYANGKKEHWREMPNGSFRTI